MMPLAGAIAPVGISAIVTTTREQGSAKVRRLGEKRWFQRGPKTLTRNENMSRLGGGTFTGLGDRTAEPTVGKARSGPRLAVALAAPLRSTVMRTHTQSPRSRHTRHSRVSLDRTHSWEPGAHTPTATHPRASRHGASSFEWGSPDRSVHASRRIRGPARPSAPPSLSRGHGGSGRLWPALSPERLSRSARSRAISPSAATCSPPARRPLSLARRATPSMRRH